MARPSLFRHRKFSKLSRLLGSRVLALGALEMLWMTCYESGDDRVGSAADIAYTIGWTDRRIDIAAAMLDAGFLDRDETTPDGFLVHDLLDHAPDYVIKRWRRERERCERGAHKRHERAAVRPVTAERRTVTAERRTVTSTPSPAPAPTPTPALERERHRPVALAPVGLDDPPSAVERLHDHWRAEGGKRGCVEPLVISPKTYAQWQGLLATHDVDALCRAITAFWATSHFEGKRFIGMFAANAPQLVAHVASGTTRPFGAPVPMPRVEDDGAARIAAWVAGTAS